jgi:hypothetical protein
VLDPYLDTRRRGEIIEDLRGLAPGILAAVEIDADLDATSGGDVYGNLRSRRFP